MNSLYSCTAATDTWSDTRREKIRCSCDMQERPVLSYCREMRFLRQAATVCVRSLSGQGRTDLGVVHQWSGLPLLMVHAVAGRLCRELGTCAPWRDAEPTAVQGRFVAGWECVLPPTVERPWQEAGPFCACEVNPRNVHSRLSDERIVKPKVRVHLHLTVWLCMRGLKKGEERYRREGETERNEEDS
jgi:hypothetical protein